MITAIKDPKSVPTNAKPNMRQATLQRGKLLAKSAHVLAPGITQRLSILA